MEVWNMLLGDILPEGLKPEKIQVPGYFLKQLGTPEGIWTIRILAIILFLTILCGWWYYEKKASKDEKNGEEEK